MKGVMKACVASIEDSIQVVEELRKGGMPKEKILILTNVTTKFAIIRNVDLRGKNGRVISSHRLLQHTRGVFHLQEYKNLQTTDPGYERDSDPVSDYWQAIQDGSIGVFLVMEEDE